MIISDIIEEVTIKVQCYLMIQTLKKSGIKGNLFNESSIQSDSKRHAQCKTL